MKIDKLKTTLSLFSKNNARSVLNKVLVNDKYMYATDLESYVRIDSTFNLSAGLYPIKQLGVFSKIEGSNEDFPDLSLFDTFKTNEISTISLSDLNLLVKHSSNDETRIYLNSIYFDNTTIVATNGYHLKHIPANLELKGTYIMPKDSIIALLKIAKAYKEDRDFVIQWSEDFFQVKGLNYTFIGRLIKREFIEYSVVIPSKVNSSFKIKKLPDLKSLKEFLNTKSNAISLVGKNSKVFYEVCGSDISLEIGECDFDFSVGFNAKYLDICAENKRDFEIGFNNNLSPCIIDNNVILMPLKL
jgi:DNA polymerase III sliding clamp (beta) subunit (PCNA family)